MAMKSRGNKNSRAENTQRANKVSRTNEIRKQAEGKYEKREKYEYDEDLAAKKAGIGCLVAVLVFVVIVAGVLLYGYSKISKEIKGKNATATGTVEIDVAKGAGGKIVGQKLKEAGLIGNDTIFRFYVRFSDSNIGFQEGHFELKPGISYDEIIEMLSQKTAASSVVKVAFPEGSTVRQFGAALEKAGICKADAFIEEANKVENYMDIEFLSKIEFDPNTYMKAEGYLAPDTYEFFTGEDPKTIVKMLYNQFNKNLNSLEFTKEDGSVQDIWQKLEEENRTLRDVVTLASIIEEEAGMPENQGPVAGVFWNRLTSENGNVPKTLGSDVTFYYIRDWIARDYDGAYENVPKDLFYAYYTADDDPKSRVGVPVGPISCPSRTAIAAALSPDKHDYYYFLTDFYGKYYYAQTYSEHEGNVATMKKMNEQYQLENPEEAEEE